MNGRLKLGSGEGGVNVCLWVSADDRAGQHRPEHQMHSVFFISA